MPPAPTLAPPPSAGPSANPSVAVAVDPARGLLRLTVRGLLTEEVLDRFERELDAARRTMQARGASPDWARVLVDARGSGVQTRAAADRLRARMTGFHAPGRRLAFLVPNGSVLRLQLGRLAEGEQFAFFGQEADALGWLFAPEP